MPRTNEDKLYIFYRKVPIFVLFILLVFALFFTLIYSSEYLSAQEQPNLFSQSEVNMTNPVTASRCNNLNISSITASGSQPANNYTNVIDNDPTTRWSDNAVSSWIQLDLEDTYVLCNIDITWYNGGARAYRFVISVANETGPYMSVFAGRSSGTTNQTEPYNISDVSGRFVEITVNGNTAQNPHSVNFAAITEVDVYGHPAFAITEGPTPTSDGSVPSSPESITSFALNNVTDFTKKPVLSVNTDKPKYAPGQVIRVLGNISNENGKTTDTNVLLETRKTHNIIGYLLRPFDFNYVENKSSILHRAFLLTKNGSYSDPITNLGSGKYNVTANASLNGDKLKDSTTFEVIDWNTSIIFFMLVVTLGFFGSLIVIISVFNEKYSPGFETWRFICISGIALLPLSAFF